MNDRNLNALLIVSSGVAVLVDILAPILLAFYLALFMKGRWRYWLYGVLVFLVFQVLTRVPVMVLLQAWGPFQEALKEPLWYWLFLSLAALTAGLFEEGGRWLAFRYLVPPEDRHWRTALMLGAGHGGLESIGVGLVVLAMFVGYLAVQLLPADTFGSAAPQVETARKQFAELQGWEPLLGSWERLSALAIQVGLTVMVLQAFRRGPRWWWYALGAHTFVDFTAVALALGLGKLGWERTGLVAGEVLASLYALLALWFIWALRPGREPAVPEASPESTSPGGVSE